MTDTKKEKAFKSATFTYTGSMEETMIWDGQKVKQGKKFTTEDESCAKQCEDSPYFK